MPRATFVLALLVSLAGACDAPSWVQGSLQSQGGKLGTLTFTPDQCMTGDSEGFVGVYLGDGTRVVKIAATPSTPVSPWTLIFYSAGPGSTPLEVFDQSDCTLLDAQTNVQDGACDVGGQVSVDCTSSDGGHVWGKLSFSDCVDTASDCSGSSSN